MTAAERGKGLSRVKSYDELAAIVKSIEPVLRENAAEAEDELRASQGRGGRGPERWGVQVVGA
jgi:hypothetical protein